ncbi:MAG: hypothetical protein QW524_02635 [Candidatus Woesearchaeota archaeon]
MKIEKLENLKKVLESTVINDNFEVTFQGIKSEKITKDSFKKIDSHIFEDEIVFIDGGSNLIFDETDLINFLCYVGFAKFRKKDLIECCIFRFDITLKLVESSENKVVYSVIVDVLENIKLSKKSYEIIEKELIHSIPKLIECDSTDNPKKISKIRRILELKLTQILSNENICILDGSFEKADKEESFLLEKIKNSIAISKKSKLLTDLGIGFERFFNQVKINTPWFVKIGRKDDYEIYAIKFTDLKNYVFRVDSKISDPENIFGYLYDLSKDGLVYGYPYGLVIIDHLARVSNEDASYYRNLIDIKYKLSSEIHEEFNDFY